MFSSKTIFVIAFILFTFEAIAEDVYISGGDSIALQAAIDAADSPGSQVTIHLEAGQVFGDTPRFSGFSGNVKIEGNGAILSHVTPSSGLPLGSIATDGVVTFTGVTFANAGTSSLPCSFIENSGRLTLERVTFSIIYTDTYHRWTVCGPKQLLLNKGIAKLANVTIVGSQLSNLGDSIIHTSASATTDISNLTVADTTFSRGGGKNPILFTDTGGSLSISSSIILANGPYEDSLVPCEGPITDNGGNFASPGDCGFSGGVIDRTSLRQVVEKGLDAWVLPLLADSIAVNAGNPEYCQKLDGRGFERDVLCDSGAYEVAASNHGGELGRGGVSGFYYTPETNGNYIQIQRAYDGNVVVIWNTFDSSGAQAWINAIGSYQDGVITAKAYRSVGGTLQPGGGASGATETDWGSLKVTAHNCWQITVEYESSDLAFGSGTFEAQRIAYVHGLGCSER